MIYLTLIIQLVISFIAYHKYQKLKQVYDEKENKTIYYHEVNLFYDIYNEMVIVNPMISVSLMLNILIQYIYSKDSTIFIINNFFIAIAVLVFQIAIGSKSLYAFSEIKHLSRQDDIGKRCYKEYTTFYQLKEFKHHFLLLSSIGLLCYIISTLQIFLISIFLGVIYIIAMFFIFILGMADVLKIKNYNSEGHITVRKKINFFEREYITNTFQLFTNKEYRALSISRLKENIRNILLGFKEVWFGSGKKDAILRKGKMLGDKVKEIEKNSKIKGSTLIVFILLIVLLPSVFWLITYSVVNLNIFSHEQINNDWIGFFGGLFGAMIGGIITLYILYKTREDSKEDRKEDKANSVKPILNAYHLDGSLPEDLFRMAQKYDYVYRNHFFSRYILKDPQHMDLKNELTNSPAWFNTELVMKNIGNGPMMNLKVSIIGKENYQSIQTFCLAINDFLIYHIYIPVSMLKTDNQNEWYQNKVVFEYEDIYGKTIEQHIPFGVRDNQNTLSDFGCISNINQ